MVLLGSVLFVGELLAVLLHEPFRPALDGLLSGTALSAISYIGTVLLIGNAEASEHPVRVMLLSLAKALVVAGAALASLAWAKVHLFGFLIGFANFTVFARVLASLVGPSGNPADRGRR